MTENSSYLIDLYLHSALDSHLLGLRSHIGHVSVLALDTQHLIDEPQAMNAVLLLAL